jgi:predicted ATPase
LLGRRAERDALDRFLAAVRVGESRTLVVRGEPGAGKTALLKYLAGRASGCRVAAATDVQSEMELAFAGLHQLLAPMLDRLERLPGPQRDALRTAFGMSAGPVPDRFLVGLAVLGLLSEMAAARPLVCLVDDEQWLDHASAQILAFVARRLGAEAVGLVFGARVPGGDLAGLPELVVGGLREDDARALLGSALTGPMDDRELGFSNWALAELTEAATRSGIRETAAGAYRRLAEITSASGTDWALGVQARSHAQLSEGEEAEGLYRQAIARRGIIRVRYGRRPDVLW